MQKNEYFVTKIFKRKENIHKPEEHLKKNLRENEEESVKNNSHQKRS